MPECGEMERLLGGSIARMESAKRELLTVFDALYPQMISDALRSRWTSAIIQAHLNIECSAYDVGKVFQLITGNELPAHPEKPTLPLHDQPINQELLAACKQALGAFEHNWAINWDDLRRVIVKAEDQPTSEKAACTECVARYKILAEAKLALELCQSSGSLVGQLVTQVSSTIAKISASTASTEQASSLEPNIKEPY